MSFENSSGASSIEVMSYDLRMDIIRRVHEGVVTVRELDGQYGEFQNSHNLPLLDRYLIASPPNDEVLAPHYRITLAPKRRTDILYGVKTIRLRVPILHDPRVEDSSEFLANDVFITNIMEDDQVARYLLTPRSYQPYAHPEDIVVDPDGLVFGSLFAVRSDGVDRPVEPAAEEKMVVSPRLLLNDLDTLRRQEELIRLYQPVVQDNRPTQDQL